MLRVGFLFNLCDGLIEQPLLTFFASRLPVSMFIISIFIVAIFVVAMFRIWGYRVIDFEERSTVLLSKAERREYLAAGCFREPRAKAARMATRLPLGRPASPSAGSASRSSKLWWVSGQKFMRTVLRK